MKRLASPQKGNTMLFRLIGKLYFYFVILPFIGRVVSSMCDTYIGYFTHKAADPEWTMQKHRAHQFEMRNRRRPRPR